MKYTSMENNALQPALGFLTNKHYTNVGFVDMSSLMLLEMEQNDHRFWFAFHRSHEPIDQESWGLKWTR